MHGKKSLSVSVKPDLQYGQSFIFANDEINEDKQAEESALHVLTGFL